MGVVEVLKDVLVANPWRGAVIAALAGYASYKTIHTVRQWRDLQFWRVYAKSMPPPPDREERDVVYLYIFPKAGTKQVPNPSPYVTKLETWMRMKGIKYQLVETPHFSKQTGQLPYIRLNGKEIADSNFIIDHLNDYFQLDPSDGATSEQLGAALAFVRMAEEHTIWTYLLYRYVYHIDEYLRVARPNIPKQLQRKFLETIGNNINNRAKAQGIGRKTEEAVASLGKKDIVAISNYLGSKKFFLGDTPTWVDCALFGQLTSVFYVDVPYPHKEVLNQCSNILPYLDRIKNHFWPDWDQVVDSRVFED